MVLRAALADAVEVGDLRRSPAARVGMPRQVAKPNRQREVDAWTEEQLHRFLEAISGHRWEAPLRLAALYGLRRSELLGLRWSAVDLRKGTVRIEQALVEVRGRPEWSDGKNARSRRTIPIDPAMAKALAGHRRFQAEERLAAGPAWSDHGLVVATRHGNPVSPGNFDQTLERLVLAAGVPRLTSHGLRHTAATHMVRHAADIGEIRAAADLLGHSPDMLMKVYAHALPESVRTVTDRIAERAEPAGRTSARIAGAKPRPRGAT
jgi:integrase